MNQTGRTRDDSYKGLHGIVTGVSGPTRAETAVPYQIIFQFILRPLSFEKDEMLFE